MTPATTSLERFLAGPGTFAVRSRELENLQADWARLRFLYCGVCGSDMSQFEARRDASYPVSLGHEFIAEVLEIGDAVENVCPGDIVTSDLNYRCGVCDRCRAGRSHLCREGQIGLFSNRAFGDFGDIHASYLLRIDGEPHTHLALSEPLSCVLHAKQWAGLQPEDRILIIGAGGIGLCMAFALCNQSPAHPFDIIDLSSNRLAFIGAAISPNGRAVLQPASEYDVVFDLSGSESGLRVGCTYVKPGGRLCSMSHLDGYTTAEFLLAALTRKDVTFTVSYLNGEAENLATATRLLTETWSTSWDRLLELVPIDQLQQAFGRRRTSPWCKTVILVDRSASLT
jgi:threonine dehydrogenase-like Zn-dependent dehydrogenase